MSANLSIPSPGPLRYLHITHCAFAISDGSALILIDPFLSGQFEWRGIIEKHLETPAFKADQIPNVDVILISHEHMDHYDVATLKTLAAKTKAKIYAPQIVIDDATKEHGMDAARFTVVHRGQQFDVGTMHVTVFPAAESEKKDPVDRVGFLIESGGRSIYHQGDSHGYSHAWAPMKNKLDAFIIWPWRVLEAAKHVHPKTFIFHHLDRFTPGDFFCNRDAELELKYHRHYDPDIQFVVPERGVWLDVATGR